MKKKMNLRKTFVFVNTVAAFALCIECFLNVFFQNKIFSKIILFFFCLMHLIDYNNRYSVFNRRYFISNKIRFYLEKNKISSIFNLCEYL